MAVVPAELDPDVSSEIAVARVERDGLKKHEATFVYEVLRRGSSLGLIELDPVSARALSSAGVIHWTVIDGDPDRMRVTAEGARLTERQRHDLVL